MTEKSKVSKKSKATIITLVVVVLIVAVALAIIFFGGNKDEEKPVDDGSGTVYSNTVETPVEPLDPDEEPAS